MSNTMQCLLHMFEVSNKDNELGSTRPVNKYITLYKPMQTNDCGVNSRKLQ